jgi:hypothetical protein
MVCKICDEHDGRFHRLYFKVSEIAHRLKPKESEDDDTESDPNLVASVAIKADGSSEPKKRKRSTTKEGEEHDE